MCPMPFSLNSGAGVMVVNCVVEEEMISSWASAVAGWPIGRCV
jgi:hypothetical protein